MEDTSKLVEQLLNKLHEGVVEFTYTKKDGSERHAKGTLVSANIPEESHLKEDDNRKKNHDTCVYYYDLDACGWRAFIKDNLKTIKED